MKKILYVTSNLMPVPAVKGGAVEMLLQILAEENETAQRAEIYIFCKYDEQAEKLSRKYKYTHIIYNKNLRNMNLMELFKSGVIGYICKKLIGKIRGKNNFIRYAYTALKVAEKYDIDEIVIEGGIYDNYRILREKYARDNIYAHFHRVVSANEVAEDVYGHTISVSEFIRREFEKGLVKKNVFDNRVLLNCSNNDFKAVVPDLTIKQIREKLKIKTDDFVILFSGRIIPEKGVKELVDAVSGLNCSNIKLIVAGTSLYADGSETEYVRSIKEEAKRANDRVKCVGFIPNNQLNEIAQISNVWCVPSTYEEPGALVLMEALNSGLPIIMTGSGGMKEYVSEECAIIVDRNSLVSDLQDAIMKLYNDPQSCQKMSEASRRRACLFTTKRFYDDFMTILGC